MKVSKRDLYILLALAGVLIAFCSYQFIFRTISPKTEVMKTENATMKAEIDEYSAIRDNIQFYQDEIDNATSHIASIVNQFPVDVLPEDEIMLARNMEVTSDYLFVSNMAFADKIELYTAAVTTTNEAGETISVEGMPSYTLYSSPYTISQDSSYQGLKDMINYVYHAADRKSISSVTVSYDSETGVLTGSTAIDMYSIVGTDKTYEKQNIKGVVLGTSNIFGTVEVAPNGAADEAEE